jgi:GNAT superfamily N-acetyltransferase
MGPGLEPPAVQRPHICGKVAPVERAHLPAIRNAEVGDVDELACLWFEGWHDAHLDIVPADLSALRTLESFRARLVAALTSVRVTGSSGAIAGFYMLRGSELYQFYVARAARGTGVARVLIADAEAHLYARGTQLAWLTCAIGNDRAARFYEKCGWHHASTFVDTLSTPAGPYQLEVWRYEKALGPHVAD